ncbi:hypothetical protein HUN33_17680 [Acinetobacter bereziniae]|nr:hypothetical protein [Acinetobacter bereziniae]MDR3028328.1 hypothetical protein [Acinetobacter sp.]MBJ8457453.1 hypothetical protein [Acinetobacter bereziniae]MBJ9904239.1 hypothetical protein [Acinetobacter bereziniae]MBJ9951173.1 hypothetical protein [Acinetobacter bereziniae]
MAFSILMLFRNSSLILPFDPSV